MIEVVVSWPAMLSILAGISALLLARSIWHYRGRPGATYFTLTHAALSLWGISYGLILLSFDMTVHVLLAPVLWFARIISAPFVLLFALDYTGRDHLLTRKTVGGLLGFWIVIALFYMTNPIHNLLWTNYHIDPIFGAAAPNVTFKSSFFIAPLLAYVSNAIAVVLILGPLVSYRRLFGRQALLIFFAVTVTTLASFVSALQLGPTAHLDIAPIVTLVTTGAIYYALFREELFEFFPATTRIATDIAIDDINAAVLTVAPSGRLIDLNEPATQLFDIDQSSALGQSLETVVGVDLPLESMRFTLSDPFGHNREFDVDISLIDSRSGDMAGYIIMFYDITDQRHKQQRLAVQNRILRHNLRNSLTVVEMGTEQLDQVITDEDAQRIVEAIQSASRELFQISEKVQKFDEGVAAEPSTIDVPELCRSVATTMTEQYPGASIEIDAGDVMTVHGQPRLLYQILQEVIENGIVHNNGQTPEITVSVTSVSEGVEISVADNGPGIPTVELEALNNDVEGPLTHGSGVGLWIIQWGMNIMGGSVSFEPDRDGTVVSLAVPE